MSSGDLAVQNIPPEAGTNKPSQADCEAILLLATIMCPTVGGACSSHFRSANTLYRAEWASLLGRTWCTQSIRTLTGVLSRLLPLDRDVYCCMYGCMSVPFLPVYDRDCQCLPDHVYALSNEWVSYTRMYKFRNEQTLWTILRFQGLHIVLDNSDVASPFSNSRGGLPSVLYSIKRLTVYV